jgi:hypothetical protein
MRIRDFIYKKIKRIGELIMQNENKDEILRSKIESQLFQIKVMLIVIIDLVILCFYGLARADWDEISGIMTRIAEIFLVVSLVVSVVIIMNGAFSKVVSTEKETEQES